MKQAQKRRVAWLLLLLMAAGGCVAPQPPQSPQERVPSPTSALAEPADALPQTMAEPGDLGAVDLRFTEILSSSGEGGAYTGCEGEDWFELYNAGTEDIDLARLFITDKAEKPDKLRLPQVVLAPGQYLAVCCCETGDHPSVNLGIRRSGEELFIFAADKREMCHVAVPPLEKDVSWALKDGVWGYCVNPTPGRENGAIFASLDPVRVDGLEMVVSELLVDGKYTAVTPDGAYCDFVELVNRSETAVSLKNWYLSDREDDPVKWAFPDRTIAPGEYVLVLLGGDGQPRSDDLLQTDFSISRQEELVIYDGNRLAYAVFSLPERIRSDVSVGGAGEYYLKPTPGRENGPAAYTVSDAGCYDFGGVFISEVCAYAGAGNNDWIELFNNSRETVSLEGWTLSKDRSGDKVIPLSGTLPAGGYAVFETTSHPERQKAGVGTFGISMGGDTLYLLDEAGNLRDEYATGVLRPNLSSGRLEGNGGVARVFFDKVTRGQKNSNQYTLGYAKAPVFSETNLYHTKAFRLTLTSGEGAAIRYTTNGTEPTASSTLYTGPIDITKNTVIRALAVQDGLSNSEIVTYTFLFEEPHDLPVVCLSFKPKDKDALWSGRSKESSSKKQRKGFFSYYVDGKLSTEFPADFKTKGAGTLGYAQASLSIHLRGKYGQSSVTYPFFQEQGWRAYSSLCIRNSGQDISHARIRDSYACRLCYGLNIDVACTRPVAVYINGKYYGLYDLNEDQNDDYLESHFGVNKDDVEIIRFNERVVKGGRVDWRRVISYAQSKDFSKDSVYNAFIEWVDPDYFIDYLICSTYLCNVDMANQKYWHTKDQAIRWRAIFYDFDYAMGYDGGSVKRSILPNFFRKSGTATATSRVYTYIAAALVQNKGWRERFIERYVELVVTTFAPERAVGVLNQLRGEMAPEMRRHIARWGRPSSYEKWEQEIASIQDWMEKRPAYALENLRKYFNLNQSYIDELVKKYTPQGE